MTQTLVLIFDQAALLVWTACVQFTLFGTALLIPMGIMRRRPASRHFLALGALVAALVSPLTSFCSYRLGWDWMPLSTWLFLVEEPREPGFVNDQSQPVDVPDTPRREVAALPPLHESSGMAPESDGRTTLSAHSNLANRPAVHPPSGSSELAASTPAQTITTRPTTRVSQARDQLHDAGDDHAAQAPGIAPTRNSLRLARIVIRSGFGAWFLGVLVMSVRIVRTQKRVKHLIDQARPITHMSALALTERIAASLKISSAPALLAAESVTNPFVASIRAPRIIVPTSLLGPASESLLAQVLVHECSHIARHDLEIGLLQASTRVLLWPHPLIHIYSAILSRSREELCDNLVLLNVSPTDYARTLLTLGERLRGLPVVAGVSLFSRRHSLSARIARLLDPSSDRSVRLAGTHRAVLTALALALAGSAVGVGPQEPSKRLSLEKPMPAASAQRPVSPLSADELVRRLAARSTKWITQSPSLESLEYDFVSGPQVTRIKVTRGEQRRHGVWTGTTLHAGFHELIKSPGQFAFEVSRGANAKTLKLVAKPKDAAKRIEVEAGNGVENSWRGYFSSSARETAIIVDVEKLVPLEEQSGATSIRYSDWREVSSAQWVPRRIEVVGQSVHYRTHFAWLGDTVWLAGFSEAVSPEGTFTLTRTMNVKVNGRDVSMPTTDSQRRSRETAQPVLLMLDHNRTWLDGGATGTGWRSLFKTLSYTFHTVREDVRESCVMDRNGEVGFEVAGDGLGKMKDRLGDRSIALNTREYGSSERGGRFALVQGRAERERGQPFDLALKHYARIGCRLDLPLFHYRERVDFITLTVADGVWNDRPCRVATVSNLGGGVFLGCGTMLASTSWSYLHDLSPSKEVIYIDPDRNVPVHETLTSSWEQKVFEIDFVDYIEVEPSQWAPRSIRIEAKDYFTCEYHFQLVAGNHWMLKEVVSWFKPEEKSHGVVENVEIDGGRELLDDALRQVGEARALFGGVGEPDRQVGVVAVPFALGRAIQIGPYEVRVTVRDEHSVNVWVSTNDRSAPATVPVCFLDEKHRSLFAPSITLTEQDDARRGSVVIRGSRVWRTVRSVVVPTMDASVARLPVNVVPFHWGESISINVPDARQGEISSPGGKNSVEGRTRAFRVRGEQAPNGTGKLTLDIVSIDGPRESYLDVAVILLSESGKLISSGHSSTSVRVEYQPVEKRLEIDMSRPRDGVQPKFIAIGVAPGNVISAPMGSKWGWYMNVEPPFDIATLLAAPDEGCRRTGLTALGRREMDESIQKEFVGDRLDERRVGDGPYSRRALLRPHVEALIRIVHEPGAADVKADAARFLAYSEVKGAAGVLEPLAEDSAVQVRDAGAIGLTFLGRGEYLDRLRSILKSEIPLGKTEAEIAAWRSFHRVEGDTLIALTQRGSNAAVDLLGETLLSDLKNLRLATEEKGQTSFEGRVDRVTDVCKLLRYTDNRRAVHWLTAAVDLIAVRRDLSEHFEQSELARSMLKFKEQTRDRIATELEIGKAPAAWAYVLRKDRDPYFVPAVRKLFQRKDVPAYTMSSGVLYLWNVGSPEAISVLQAAYDRGKMRDEPRQWLRLCEALAANGDGRGLADAYEHLVGLKRPANPPMAEKELRNWTSARDDRRREAEAVFQRASKKILMEFLLRKTQVGSPWEQLVVLELLWRLPELPEPLRGVVSQWSKSADAQVAEMAKRLLTRD
jgi:beta-lactamase regulating signal transducer with metallopeptidase domain